MEEINTMSPQKAWESLAYYRYKYYDNFDAMYSGDYDKLKYTAKVNTFWKRAKHSNKMHIPIAGDIAAASADLLFSEPPTATVASVKEEAQTRLDRILEFNEIQSLLSEGAEIAAIFGDVYYKIRWNANDAMFPIVDVAQPDTVWAEYRFGEMYCAHFFTPLKIDYQNDRYLRVYERYTAGLITCKLFAGTSQTLGAELPESETIKYGIQPEIKTPVESIFAAHIANIRPNRSFRDMALGRSDLDDLRDMCDALDECWSSWLRDIRMAKARTIVPVDYLKRKPSEMLDGVSQAGSWEFDPDVETYVAMDIDTSSGTQGIQTQQFAIRASEHASTALQLVQDILTHAGYSPQTFGLNINGSSTSGTALNIRERRSTATRDKKRTYWKQPLEKLLTTVVQLDAAIYPNAGSVKADTVQIAFSQSAGTDIQQIAQTVQMLTNAQAVSLGTKVDMLHPDWTQQQKDAEIEEIKAQYAIEMESPMDAGMGDFEKEVDGE